MIETLHNGALKFVLFLTLDQSLCNLKQSFSDVFSADLTSYRLKEIS